MSLVYPVKIDLRRSRIANSTRWSGTLIASVLLVVPGIILLVVMALFAAAAEDVDIYR